MSFRKLAEERYQKRVLGEVVPNNYEIEIIKKDGSYLPVEVNASRVDYEDSPADMALIRDITERKQAEEHVTHLNSVLRALRNINQLITHEPDRERLIQEGCNILVKERGYEKAWVLLVDEKGKPVLMASAGIGGESLAFLEQIMSGEYPCCLKELLAQKEPLLVYDRPGSRHDECILSSIHKERGVYRCRLEYSGKVYGTIGVTLSSALVADEEEQALFLELAGDISYALAAIERQEERRRAQEEIKMLARFPGENPSPVLRVAGDGTILYANTASSLLLKKWHSKEGGVLSQHWREYISEVLDSGVVKSMETGCDDWVLLLRFTPIKEAGYVNIYGTDITERKRAEAALNEREVRLRELSRI